MTPYATRRAFLASMAALALPPPLGAAAPTLTRPIPSTGERIPAVGMGTWITFNVGANKPLRDNRAKVLQAFFDGGGAVIDSSPMYGSSEDVVGYGLKRVTGADALFSATKVWTWWGSRGPGQMDDSHRLWGVDPIDLMQVHNLVQWEDHLKTIRERKAAGRVRYVGVTTSHGRRHDEMAAVMAAQPLDFVQFTYNILDREAEARLLPIAADRGLAVIVNRPFRGGALFDMVGGHPVPEWAGEFGAATWSQFLLKFILSHPAVTCTIPATSRLDHMGENMAALRGPLPDGAMRRRMAAHVEGL